MWRDDARTRRPHGAITTYLRRGAPGPPALAVEEPRLEVDGQESAQHGDTHDDVARRYKACLRLYCAVAAERGCVRAWRAAAHT